MGWFHPPVWALGGERSFPNECAHFLLILTLRVHCSLPSGRGISLGRRSGSSNSPRDPKGDCRCRLSEWILMLSCLATSETISSFVMGVRSSFPVEMYRLNTKSALSSRFAAV
uniref:Uncharacterized protein n=1 Tax=Arundo donax TaxID=35708 RepID=A0A0A9G2Y4_ARUDO